MRHGRLYVALTICSLDRSRFQLIAWISCSTVRTHGLQSLAVVLLDAYAFKLPGNNFNSRRAEFLALAVVDGSR